MPRWPIWPVPRTTPPPLGPSRVVFRLIAAPPPVEVPSIKALRGLFQSQAIARASRVMTITEGAAPVAGEGVYIPTFRPRRR